VFDRLSRSARDLGVSTSDLVAAVLIRHLDDLERASLVADMNPRGGSGR